MDRRDFLKVAGATMLVSSVPLIAREQEPTTAAELARALEALFPKVESMNTAWIERDGYRAIAQTYGLGMAYDCGLAVAEVERRIVRNLWASFSAIAARPEHVGATLIWRREPEFTEGEATWLGGHPFFGGCFPIEHPHKLTARFAILPTPAKRGTRVAEVGAHHKPEGCLVEVIRG